MLYLRRSRQPAAEYLYGVDRWEPGQTGARAPEITVTEREPAARLYGPRGETLAVFDERPYVEFGFQPPSAL